MTDHPSPVVSVIVTSLNRPTYVRQACASVLDGSFEAIELFICDDASDDPAARDAAADIAAKDERVILIQNDQRLGQFRSIARAMERMHGRYFAILNDDDSWQPEFLSKLVRPLEHDPELVASFCDHFIMDADGQVDLAESDSVSARCHRADLGPGRHEDSGHLALGLSAFPTVVATVFRGSAVNWDRYLGARMDVTGFYDLWLQACVLGNSAPVWYESERLSSYRVHNAQLMSKRNVELTRAKIWILDQLLSDERFGASQQAVARQLSASAYALGMSYLKLNHVSAARTYLWWACLARPRSRALLGLLLTFNAGPITKLRARLVSGGD